MTVSPVLGWWRLDDQGFKTILRYMELGDSLGYTRLCLKKEDEAKNIIYLVESLPDMEKVLGLLPSNSKPGMGADTHLSVSNKQNKT